MIHKILMVILLMFAWSGCGTEIGNPGDNPQANNDTGGMPNGVDPGMVPSEIDVDVLGTLLDQALMAPCLSLFETPGLDSQVFGSAEGQKLEFYSNNDGFEILIDDKSFATVVIVDSVVDRIDPMLFEVDADSYECLSESEMIVDDIVQIQAELMYKNVEYTVSWNISDLNGELMIEEIKVSSPNSSITYKKVFDD